MDATKPFTIAKQQVVVAFKAVKAFKGHKTRAGRFLQGIAERQPGLFVHWQQGMVGAFA